MDNNIYGVVDSVGINSISGWVASKNANVIMKGCKVFVYKDGNLIGEGSCDKQGPTLSSGSIGWRFFAPISEKVELVDFVDENVYIQTVDGTNLSLWEPLSRAGQITKYSRQLKEIDLGFIPLDVRKLLANIIMGAGTKAFSKSDKNVSIGKNSHLFLSVGTNKVAEMYGKDINPSLVRDWQKLIEKRIRICKKYNASFLQIFIPEKSSVLWDIAPFPAKPVSKQYDAIVKKLALKFKDSFFDANTIFRNCSARDSLFRLQDSHLSSYGCESIINELMRVLGIELSYKLNQMRSDGFGDLGGRFENLPGWEEESALIFQLYCDQVITENTPSLIDSFDPDNGKHTGIVRHFKQNNPSSTEIRAICFGNSFCERGDSSQWLSWWFARIFKEYRFVWDASLLEDEIDKFKPDLVICQTIERFVWQVPNY